MCVPQPHTYYASKEKQSAVLPAFPDIKVLTLPESISRDKVGGWVGVHMCVCMCVCLRHLVKVGGSISSNHIMFAMTASVLVINNALLAV